MKNRIRTVLALVFAASLSTAAADVVVEDLGTYNSFGCGMVMAAAQSISDHSFYCVRGAGGNYTLYEVYVSEVVTVNVH